MRRVLGDTGAVGPGLLTLAGFALWNLGNYAFFLVAGRLLGPEDYGLLAAILAAVLVVQIPPTSLQGALARLVGGYGAGSEGVYATAARRAGLLTGIALALLALGLTVIATVVPSLPLGPLLAGLLILVPAAVFPLSLGQLQGEERYVPFAVSTALFGLPRPLFLVGLSALGLGIYAALFGTAFTAALAAVVALAYTRRAVTATPVARSARIWREFRGSLAPFAIGIGAIAVLFNVDVVAAKLALDDVDAGRYAAAAVLAKAVFLGPQAISTVTVPRVARLKAAQLPTDRALALAVWASLAIGAVGVALVAFLSEEIVRMTFGSSFSEGADLLVALTAASTAIGVLLVLLYHQLALGRYRFAYLLTGVAAIQIIGLTLLHDDAWSIIAVNAFCGILGVLVYELSEMRGDSILRGTLRILSDGKGP